MSHPADEFSQHLSDDDVLKHEDASDNGDATNKPKQQQLISTATTISNIKLPILKKEEYRYVIGFGIIRGYIYVYIIAWRPARSADTPECCTASSDYVPGPEEPEQAPLSLDYIPGLEYPKYLAPSDVEVPVEDQPYVIADSPIALSPSYVADSDPEENL
ncbi:hypothetical protein Tco_0268231 [Tanacetum coccineum]